MFGIHIYWSNRVYNWTPQSCQIIENVNHNNIFTWRLYRKGWLGQQTTNSNHVRRELWRPPETWKWSFQNSWTTSSLRTLSSFETCSRHFSQHSSKNGVYWNMLLLFMSSSLNSIVFHLLVIMNFKKQKHTFIVMPQNVIARIPDISNISAVR